MEFARKMILIPEDRLTRHIPTDEQLSDLDKEMKSIMLSKMDDDTKIKMYNDILQKRIRVNMLNPPILSASQEKDESEDFPTKSELATKETFTEDFIIDSMNKYTKKAAKNIVDFIQQNKNIISWNSLGELIIKGRTINNSNIVDNIDYLISNRKSNNPVEGVNSLLTMLKELNIPRVFIKNKSIEYENIQEVKKYNKKIKIESVKNKRKPVKNAWLSI